MIFPRRIWLRGEHRDTSYFNAFFANLATYEKFHNLQTPLRLQPCLPLLFLLLALPFGQFIVWIVVFVWACFFLSCVSLCHHGMLGLCYTGSLIVELCLLLLRKLLNQSKFLLNVYHLSFNLISCSSSYVFYLSLCVWHYSPTSHKKCTYLLYEKWPIEWSIISAIQKWMSW